MYQSDEDFGEGVEFSEDMELVSEPDVDLPEFQIKYVFKDNKIEVSVETNNENFDPEDLALFLNFIMSGDGVRTTLETIKEGLESAGQVEQYRKFIISFLKLKEQAIARSKTGSSDEPLIRPIDVL